LRFFFTALLTYFRHNKIHVTLALQAVSWPSQRLNFRLESRDKSHLTGILTKKGECRLHRLSLKGTVKRKLTGVKSDIN
jgi:hypothetical protein